MRSNAKCFDNLRAYIETVPLVDCHDHSSQCGPKYDDAMGAIITGYFHSDMVNASSDEDMKTMKDRSLSLDERWPVFERAWKRTCHTGYAHVHRRAMKRFYGIEEMSLAALKDMQGRLLDLTDEKAFEAILEEAKIKVRLLNVFHKQSAILDGSYKITPRGRIVIPLPRLHAITNFNMVKEVGDLMGMYISSLDEYLDACRKLFDRYKDLGAVAFKDQSAYARTLDVGNPPRAEAEKIFNWFMEDPRRQASYPDGIMALDDYLFHEFLRAARDMDLPVQIHTGHMAGTRNDIAKTNAVHLTKVIELHRDVRFDLFHANWPYSGEILYLAKNHPNVAIDFCWANIIDPIYCQNMFKQAISSVPHGKIHGYGSDYSAQADCAWAHAAIARDNIAIALADLVEMEWLSLDEAKQVAYDWMFGNANEFFRLGM